MRQSLLIIGVVGTLACAQLCAADSAKNTRTVDLQSFSGTWKEDLKSSHTPASALSRYALLRFEKDESGVLQRSVGPQGKPQPMRLDGKDYAVDSNSGRTVAWTKEDANTYTVTGKLNGTITGTTRYVLSDHGQKLVVETHSRVGPSNRFVYNRTSGSGETLEGTWTVIEFEKMTPGTMTIAISGDTIEVLHSDAPRISAKFDGKEYPPVADLTVKFEPLRTHELCITTLKNHHPYYVQTWHISQDGRTLTSTGVPENGNAEPTVTVYRRS